MALNKSGTVIALKETWKAAKAFKLADQQCHKRTISSALSM